MLIARIARVRYLVIGEVGELVIFNEHMIGNNVELADVMTRSTV